MRMGFGRRDLSRKLQLPETHVTKIDKVEHGFGIPPNEHETASPDGSVAIRDGILVELRSASRWLASGHSLPVYNQKLMWHVTGVFKSPIGQPGGLSLASFPYYLTVILSLSTNLEGFWFKHSSNCSVSQKTGVTMSQQFSKSTKWARKRVGDLRNDHRSKVLWP